MRYFYIVFVLKPEYKKHNCFYCFCGGGGGAGGGLCVVCEFS